MMRNHWQRVLLTVIFVMATAVLADASVISNQKAQIKKLQQENAALKKNVDESGKVLAERDMLISSLEKDKQELTAMVISLQKELDDKTIKISELENELVPTSELRAKLKENDTEIKNSIENLEGRSRQIARLEKEKLQLQKDLDNTKKLLNLVIERSDKKNREKLEKEARIHREADLNYNEAVVLFEKREYGAAISRFKRVLELRPNDKDSLYNLAIIYDEYLKDSRKALDYYRAFLKMAPEDQDCRKVREWIMDKEAELKIKE